MDYKREAQKRLREFGVKPSVQRIAIMEHLIKYPVHPTADMIYAELFPSIPTLSKTTVYNTLKLLSEQGAVQTITIDEKNLRYDADISVHAHFKCKKCGRVYDFSVKYIDLLQITGAKGFLITESQLYYKGCCAHCNDQSDKAGNKLKSKKSINSHIFINN
jgi:Fur family ferric uptake transcriptional regulator/Fur family peroxide stress response transcriptional regulator